VPEHCPDVPDDVLNPRQTWADKETYDQQTRKLIGLFEENFAQFVGQISSEVTDSGPSL